MVVETNKLTMENNLIEYIPETDSTNIELHRQTRNNASLPHGYCVITDYQHSGHGQANNSWESERGKNILCSILLRPEAIAVADQFIITEIVSLAIRDTLQDEITDEIEIKWPNDIYVGDRKICGILIENSVCGSTLSECVVGMGININQTTFLSDAPNPISLQQISGNTHNRKAIIEKIHNSILTKYNNLANDNDGLYHKELDLSYRAKLYHRTGWHTYRRADEMDTFRAQIASIDSFGRLTLEHQNGTLETFAFKEVVQNIDHRM